VVRLDFVSLFPEMIRDAMSQSVLGRAQEKNLIAVRTANPREFCYDRHQKVDDTPFGGEPGMLIKVDPVALAIASLAAEPSAEIILTAPTGRLFCQETAWELSKAKHLIFLCGRYEGFDHRVEEVLSTRVFSIGDYVLTNGELPSLVMADAVARLIPGVLGEPGSLRADSHSDGLLSAPNYTRPEVWQGNPVPEVLLSGNHRAVAQWRRKWSLRSTASARPDLLAKANLKREDLVFLQEARPD
jgi:tRNA (guanine37-N1)-methyltransferase